ncbi:MAG TPA: hypothetical protein VJK02_21170 [Anaerolineales bacterium]|nr:hypothetical protein [Anaerolineales bacterium]
MRLPNRISVPELSQAGSRRSRRQFGRGSLLHAVAFQIGKDEGLTKREAYARAEAYLRAREA